MKNENDDMTQSEQERSFELTKNCNDLPNLNHGITYDTSSYMEPSVVSCDFKTF